MKTLLLITLFLSACNTIQVNNDGPAQTPVKDPLIKPCKLTPEDLVPAWAKAPKITTEVYVNSKLGLDTNSGLSKLLPLKTTSAALKKLAPGVRLNFMTGTYDCKSASDIKNVQGGTDSPTVINSIDGPRKAVFDCGGTGHFILTKVNGFIFEGIELKNTTGHGIQTITGPLPFDPNQKLSSDIVVHNSYIHDTGLASVKASQSVNLYFIGNEVAFNGKEVLAGQDKRQFFESVACDNTVIAGNDAHNGQTSLDEIKGAAQGAIIFHNYIHDQTDGIYVGGYSTCFDCLVHPEADYEAQNIQVWDNKLVNISRVPFVFISCHNCSVANNTVWNSGDTQNAFMINKDSFFLNNLPYKPLVNDGLTIKNNILNGTGKVQWMIASSQSDIKTVSMTNNLWSYGNTKLPGGDIEYRNEPTSLYQVSPGFVSSADYHLNVGSPAIGKGVASTNLSSPDKANWDNTCWGSTPNMGAY